ncbi:MAG TPA: hypothetical protein VFJ07_10640, partial [Streptosporangiaceae bacterium]|nr:hypothetical protein [Streptosporangiaceae bacterium]
PRVHGARGAWPAFRSAGVRGCMGPGVAGLACSLAGARKRMGPGRRRGHTGHSRGPRAPPSRARPG